MRRARAAAPGAAGLVALTVLLAGCGPQPGDVLARRACVHVDHSIRLYRQAEKTTDPAVAIERRNQALAELRAALPLAAAATSDNGQWIALETTISESARVDEALLVNSLHQQCLVVENPNSGLQPVPGPLPSGA